LFEKNLSSPEHLAILLSLHHDVGCARASARPAAFSEFSTRSTAAAGDHSRGDLSRGGGVLAEAQDVQLLVDDERRGIARVRKLRLDEPGAADRHEPASRIGGER